MKLGKKPARIDKRTIPLECVLKALPPIPETFDLDNYFPTPMFANDKYGDCVIAGRAHQTMRFEHFEQDTILNITDEEVLEEYWKEGRRFCFDKFIKPDRGLVMLDSMKAWRKGWIAAEKEYNIYAFAKIDQFSQYETKAAMYLLNGINIGIMLPTSAQQQTIWEDVGDTPGSWGGHCVFIIPVWREDDLLTCVTWGYEQLMTWGFFTRYTDEAYAIVDDRNKWMGEDSPLDIDLLESYLKEVTK